MKLFLVDLLGRDTLEAKIFLRAVEKEMNTIFVLSNFWKVVAVVTMVMINFYFIFGSVLYARGKSTSWQLMWLQVLSFNLFIDIMYTSFVEVVVLRYAIPAAISNRAAEIKEKLDDLISKISELNDDHDDQRSKSFSVTDWFFVSNYIAKKRTDVPESSIVLAYRSVSPKDISNKFNHLILTNSNSKNHKSHNSDNNNDSSEEASHTRHYNKYNGLVLVMMIVLDIAQVLLKLVTVALLQIGVLPDFIQTVIIRISQVYLILILLL